MRKTALKFVVASSTIIIIVIALYFFVNASASAATGINRQINFQGKLVNPNGTNVADSTYAIVFTMYDATSGGTNLWTETQSVQTNGGIFRVALGSVTAIPSNFNFNWDGLYLGIKVGADTEMTPRVRMAAVPYAFNAQQVAGLTVQDENGNASTSGTLKIPNAKTVSFAGATSFGAGTTGLVTLGSTTNALTLTTTGDTSVTLPVSGTLLTNTATAVQTITSTQTTGTIFGITDSTALTGAIKGAVITLSGANAQDQTGLEFNLSGATGTNLNDIVGTGSSWKVSKAGVLTVASCTGCGGGGSSNWDAVSGALFPKIVTQDLLFGGTSTASALFRIAGSDFSGTRSAASVSANTSFAAMVVNNNSTFGDLFTASSSGLARFVINNNGNVGIGTALPLARLDVSGVIRNDTEARFSTGVYDNTGPSLEIGDGQYGLSAEGGDLRLWSATGFRFQLNDASDTVRMLMDSAGRLGIGTTSPLATLHVNGTNTGGNAAFIINQAGVSANDIFAASSSGVTKFRITNNGTASSAAGFTIDGSGSLQTTLNQSLTIGGDTTGTLILKDHNNTVFKALGDNILVGVTAGNAITTAGSNTMLGYQAGLISTAGYNTFIGDQTGLANTTGQENTFLGRWSGRANSLGSSNAFLGAYSGLSNTLGTNNTFLGSTTGTGTTTGSNNVFVGGGAGANNIGGGLNTMFGQNADLSSGHLINAGAIGANAYVDQNDALVLGSIDGVNSATGSAKIGIGTIAPIATLDVRGLSTAAIASISGTTSFAALVANNNGTTGDLFTASASGLTRFVINNNGNITANGTLSGLTGLTLSSGPITLGGATGSGLCLLGGASASWGACSGGPAGGSNWDIVSGVIYPKITTQDFLFGGTTSISATFRLTGNTGAAGTSSVASIAANTSFAGLVIDQKGQGDLLTGSTSGLTRFVMTQQGGLTLGGNRANDGYKLDVMGTARIGDNTILDNVVKKNTSDFTQSGYSSASVTTDSDRVKLKVDNIAVAADPVAGPVTSVNMASFSAAFKRQNGSVFIVTGNGTNTLIYDHTKNGFISGPALTNANASNSAIFARQNGKLMIVRGNTSNVYDPAGASHLGSVTTGPGLDFARTTKGFNKQPVVGAGNQTIPLTDGKTLLILGGDVPLVAGDSKYTQIYDPISDKFEWGPSLTADVSSGSAVFQRQNGKWIVIMGGGTATTNIYDPSINTVGSGGGAVGPGRFEAGPNLATGNAGLGAHVFQLPDGRFMVINGGNTTATNIYDPVAGTFASGPTLPLPAGTGAQSFQRSDEKWVTLIGNGTNRFVLYDPVGGAFSLPSTNTVSGSVGVGALTIQRDDGRYLIVHGGGYQIAAGSNFKTTTIFDAGWNTTGSWISEDINNTKLSTNSAIIWNALPQVPASPSSNIQFYVKTAATQGGLSSANYLSVLNSGDLIQAVSGAAWVKIQMMFYAQIPNIYAQQVPYNVQNPVWPKEGGTSYFRKLLLPVAFDFRIINPIAAYGGYNFGDVYQGRNPIATQGAIFENVVTDTSTRISLSPSSYTATGTQSAGIVIASAAANIGFGGTAGAGSHTLQRQNGKFITILGNATSATRIYDANTGTFTVGPVLSTAQTTTNSFSILLPDGRFLVFAVGAAAPVITNFYDPNLGADGAFYEGPRLTNAHTNMGVGAHAILRPDGKYLIYRGNSTTFTDIYDPVLNQFIDGPRTLVPVGAGAFSVRRPDGRYLTASGGNATTTFVYDPISNTFKLGLALAAAVSTNGNATQLKDGRIFILRTTTTSETYNPGSVEPNAANTSIAGPTMSSIGAGSQMIQLPDGRVMVITGGGTVFQVYDPVSNTLTGTNGVLPNAIGAGSHAFMLPNGKYMLINGGNAATTMMIDVGWNLKGVYISEPIYSNNLTALTALYMKNVGQGNITAKIRTAPDLMALSTSDWRDVEKDDTHINPSTGDDWVQVRLDFQAIMPNQMFEKTRVWSAADQNGFKYWIQPQSPVLAYWRLVNVADPTIMLLTNQGSNVFRFQADGQAFTTQNGAWNAGGADLAERYTSNQMLAAGEVVVNDPANPQGVMRSTQSYQDSIMGVVSTEPGFVAGAYTKNSYPIGLVGRVPVKVSTENGQIKSGDSLTAASIPGYAMKADKGGRILGKALESLDQAKMFDCPKEGFGSLTTTQCGSIMMFVNLTNYNGESVEVAMKDKGFTDDGLVTNENGMSGNVPLILGNNMTDDQKHEQAVLAFLRMQKDEAVSSSVYTDRVSATHDVISPKIITDLLVAKKIKADSIEGLDILLGSRDSVNFGTSSATFSMNVSEKLTNLSDQVATLSSIVEHLQNVDFMRFIPMSSASSDFATVNSNFMVFGSTTLSEATIINNLSIGNSMKIGDGSIDAVGKDLEIQGLRQGKVSFMGGLIEFDTEGNLKVSGNAEFAKDVNVKGVLSAKSIKGSELTIQRAPVDFVSEGVYESSGAAGLVRLGAGSLDVKINDPLVKDTSIIFIAPKTKLEKPLFIKEQVEGESFTVGTDNELDVDVDFNFLIVN